MRTTNPMVIKPITDNQILELHQLAAVAKEAGEIDGFLRLESTADQLRAIKQFVDNDVIPGGITIGDLINTVHNLSGED